MQGDKKIRCSSPHQSAYRWYTARLFRKILIGIGISCSIIVLTAGCSTKKNTSSTRFYHALTTKYNVYFNGKEAYKAGSKAIDQGNKDNYMDILPLYPIGNKTTIGTGGGDFDRAIEKSQKAIREHSIKKRPARKPGRNYSPEYKKWLARREFNPFLHNAWMLMGKAQFQKGDFPEAASTFSYIARLYAGQPDITADARIWLSRCYAQLGWHYDAEDVLEKVNNDSLPYTLIPEHASAYGNFLIGSERYREAVPYLLTTIKNEKNKRQKTREYYLLGQIYQLLQERNKAYDAYGRVIRLSPPYELELNARIRQTEVMAAANTKKTTEKLRRMTRSEKNKDYLDQIYYALGNTYMAQQDTAHAITEYLTGVEKSTRGGVEKGMLQLTLGNIFWQQARYAEAQVAYADAIGLINKEHTEYKQVTKRSEVLDELVEVATAVELQDSLQHLASLSDAERMKAIEGLIAEVVRKEEEAKKLEEEQKRQELREAIAAEGESNNRQPAVPSPQGPVMDKSWYFYNPQLVTQGKTEFQRLWGRRKLEDNWRRKNKTVVTLDNFEKVNYDEMPETEGGAVADGDAATQQAQPTDSVPNEKDPQFYLQQIPLTPEAMKESNDILSDGLFNLGSIFKDKLEDFTRSEESFNRLIRQFPEFKQLDEAYYNLYLMLSRQHKTEEAARYKAELLERFPESKYAKTLQNPDFVYNAIHGKHLEDSLYVKTYQEYQNGNYKQVVANSELSSTKYPMGKHRPKFLFLHAVTALQANDQKQFLIELKDLVQNYPDNEITELAAYILKGVQEGRLLAKGSSSFGSIWKRRSAEALLARGEAGDSTAVADSLKEFSIERNAPYLFLLAYEEGKVNENQLLYEVARYNFSSFMVKNFDLSFSHDNGIGRLLIRSFANYDEALQYFRRLYEDKQLNERLSGMRAVIISEANYELLNKLYSFDEYDAFYKLHFPVLPGQENIPIDGSTLDEPLQNLPDEKEETPEEDGEELPQGGSNEYFIIE